MKPLTDRTTHLGTWFAPRAKGLALALAIAGAIAAALGADGPAAGSDTEVERLSKEVSKRGWLLFTARSELGDYDLYVSRPDGSSRLNVTQTPQWSEFGGRFSPDFRRILYRRLPKGPDIRKGEGINHDVWGAMGTLIIANADGSNPVIQGKPGELPWASWSPDSKRFTCLHRREGVIRIVDIETKQVVQELPRQGIFQQCYMSPDGERVCGTANVNGQDWNVVSMELATQKLTLISRGLNCTGDWFQSDSHRAIYSNRTPGLGSDYGWTMLMQGTADGRSRALIYGERGRHVYYGCVSPDDRYALFSLPETDGGTDAPMAIVRIADTPIIAPADYRELKALFPQARGGPILRLPILGFEPHWTYSEIARDIPTRQTPLVK